MRYLTIEQRERLQKALDSRAAILREEIAAEQPLPNHALETGDAAVADLETSVDAATLERDVLELREVEAALVRIHQGNYGICAGCGDDIPFSRLRANPVATHCTACAARAERVRPARL
jgi:DnaK suppressor protein